MNVHFITHGAKRGTYYRGRTELVRSLCDRFVPGFVTCTLRETGVVKCSACMVVKDKWLEQPKRKPLTIRRLRILMNPT